MSLQTELNKIVEFMRKQGRPAHDPERKSCLYRGPDNTKCAVGCRISDEFLAKHNIEQSLRIGSFPPAAIDELSAFVEVSGSTLVSFYSHIQFAHDKTASVAQTSKAWLADFEDEARSCAKHFNLTYPEPAA